MKKLEVYDPAMCCSTGVCGPEVDPVLVTFAADLKWVAEQGVIVQRFNLGQEPQAFAAILRLFARWRRAWTACRSLSSTARLSQLAFIFRVINWPEGSP